MVGSSSSSSPAGSHHKRWCNNHAWMGLQEPIRPDAPTSDAVRLPPPSITSMQSACARQDSRSGAHSTAAAAVPNVGACAPPGQQRKHAPWWWCTNAQDPPHFMVTTWNIHNATLVLLVGLHHQLIITGCTSSFTQSHKQLRTQTAPAKPVETRH